MGRARKQPLIYIVDDQAMLLDLAKVSLKDCGCVMKTFHDPGTALQAFEKARSKPALLITDYAMGKMNGLDLIQKCKALSPALKTILMSGTMGAEILFETTTGVDQFIAKPYQPETLLALVQRVLHL